MAPRRKPGLGAEPLTGRGGRGGRGARDEPATHSGRGARNDAATPTARGRGRGGRTAAAPDPAQDDQSPTDELADFVTTRMKYLRTTDTPPRGFHSPAPEDRTPAQAVAFATGEAVVSSALLHAARVAAKAQTSASAASSRDELDAWCARVHKATRHVYGLAPWPPRVPADDPLAAGVWAALDAFIGVRPPEGWPGRPGGARWWASILVPPHQEREAVEAAAHAWGGCRAAGRRFTPRVVVAEDGKVPDGVVALVQSLGPDG